MKRIVILCALLLAGCNQPVQPSANDAEIINSDRVAPTPVPSAPPANGAAPAGDLAAYIAGAWSFDSECATDFILHYNADGSLQNAGDTGTWKIEGDTLTETITERIDDNGEPQKLSPADKRSYTVARVDQGHAVLTFQGKKIPILRC